MTTATTQFQLLLIEYVDRYAKAKNLNKATTVRGYRLAANSLGHHHGRAVRIVELTDVLITEWAKSLLEAGFSATNIDVMRRHVEVLWRAAHAEGLCVTAPKFRYHRRKHVRHVAAQKALERHLLLNDLVPDTQKYYRRNVGTFTTWAGDDPRRQEFTADTVSEFLRDKQLQGVKSYYLKSLRHSLRTLLLGIGDSGKVRKVKLQPLENYVWREPEIAKILAAVPLVIFPRSDTMRALYRRYYWRTLLLGAWYTGLSCNDLHRLDESHVDFATGRVEIRRNKTGKRVITWLPPELLAEVRDNDGPFWKHQTCEQTFRDQFNRIVAKAGLAGPFKKLRKSSGTRADELHPGRGHVHLGNTRRVFEIHYQAADVYIEPIRLAAPAMAEGGAA